MKKNSAILEPEFRIEFANVKADSAGGKRVLERMNIGLKPDFVPLR